MGSSWWSIIEYREEKRNKIIKMVVLLLTISQEARIAWTKSERELL